MKINKLVYSINPLLELLNVLKRSLCQGIVFSTVSLQDRKILKSSMTVISIPLEKLLRFQWLLRRSLSLAFFLLSTHAIVFMSWERTMQCWVVADIWAAKRLKSVPYSTGASLWFNSFPHKGLSSLIKLFFFYFAASCNTQSHKKHWGLLLLTVIAYEYVS